MPNSIVSNASIASTDTQGELPTAAQHHSVIALAMLTILGILAILAILALRARACTYHTCHIIRVTVNTCAVLATYTYSHRNIYLLTSSPVHSTFPMVAILLPPQESTVLIPLCLDMLPRPLTDDKWFGDSQEDRFSGILVRQRLTNMIP